MPEGQLATGNDNWAVGVGYLLPWQEVQLPPSPFKGFNAFNPSVHRDPSGVWRCSVRNCDYDTRGGVYSVRNGTIRTRNTLLTLDVAAGKLPEVTGSVELVEDDGLPRFQTSEHGYEDLRLFWHDGGLSAIATTAQLRRESAQEVCLLNVDPTGLIAVATPIRGPWSRTAQKNWSPFDDNPGLSALYTVDPWREMDLSTPWVADLATTTRDPLTAPTRDPLSAPGRSSQAGNMVDVRHSYPRTPVNQPDGWEPTGLRGSSQLIRAGGRWLAVGHEMDIPRHKATGRKHYRHRFYDNLGGRSPWFTFDHEGIEFCAGMALDPDTDRLVLSFGVGDCEAWLGVTDLRAVLNLLNVGGPT